MSWLKILIFWRKHNAPFYVESSSSKNIEASNRMFIILADCTRKWTSISKSLISLLLGFVSATAEILNFFNFILLNKLPYMNFCIFMELNKNVNLFMYMFVIPVPTLDGYVFSTKICTSSSQSDVQDLDNFVSPVAWL